MAEMLHGLVHSQQFAVVRAVLLLGWVQLPVEEGEGLPGVVDALLQHSTHGGSGGVRDQCERRGRDRVCQESGPRQTRLALFEGPVEIRRPGDWMRAFHSGAGESGVERCLGSSGVWQKSPVEI
jgi:hypothetical protein